MDINMKLKSYAITLEILYNNNGREMQMSCIIELKYV